MTSPNIQDQIPKNLAIPTLPEVVLKVRQLVGDPNTGTREIGTVVAEDAPLLAKVLKMANSAFYGLAGRCVSAEQACTVLGVRVVSNIVTQVGVLQAYQHLDDVEIVREIWDHSLQAAELSVFLTKRVTYRRVLDSSDFYTYGLLHDLGKIALIETLGTPYVSLLKKVRSGNLDLIGMEQQQLGYDHARVGALIANRWALPETVQHTLLYHHGPLEQVKNDPAVAIVYTANRLVSEAPNSDVERLLAILREPAIATLGLDEGRAQEVVDFSLGRRPEVDIEDDE